MSNILGAPSINHRPYTMSIPRAFMAVIVSASSGLVGVRGSTSTAACNILSKPFDLRNVVTYGSTIERADEGIAVAILGSGDGGFRLDHGVDASNYAVELSRGRAVVGGYFLPRLAASVETSKSTWSLISRFDESGSSMVPLVCEPAMSPERVDILAGSRRPGCENEGRMGCD